MMTEQLPITINITSELANNLKGIRSVSNKLEAQLNFKTLTANWYGDEEDILTINFYLEGIEDYKKSKDQLDMDPIQILNLADDVFSHMNNLTKVLNCHIEITSAELQLLAQQPKLLSRYLSMKLIKVLNLLAKPLGYAQI